MLILQSDAPAAEAADAPVSPLNAVWLGRPRGRVVLPELGHLFLVFPLEDASLVCAGTRLDGERYLWLTRPAPPGRPYALEDLRRGQSGSRLLLLLLSPDFIADMAGFLGIPPDLGELLHGVPLPQGDAVSRTLRGLADAIHSGRPHEETEELFLEVVGHTLGLLRLRGEGLLGLSGHRRNTVDDLLPRLLRARQFIEARCLEPIKTRDVARHVALSEYHFARLFKAAFDVTVHQYALRLRLAEARRLLEASEASVTEIALSIGYSSLSAFIHAFRRQFGQTPTSYRKAG